MILIRTRLRINSTFLARIYCNIIETFPRTVHDIVSLPASCPITVFVTKTRIYYCDLTDSARLPLRCRIIVKMKSHEFRNRLVSENKGIAFSKNTHLRNILANIFSSLWQLNIFTLNWNNNIVLRHHNGFDFCSDATLNTNHFQKQNESLDG